MEIIVIADKLKLHILTHSSVRPSLQCKVCNKTFQRQAQLRQHDRTHHQVAPHTCETCGLVCINVLYAVCISILSG